MTAEKLSFLQRCKQNRARVYQAVRFLTPTLLSRKKIILLVIFAGVLGLMFLALHHPLHTKPSEKERFEAMMVAQIKQSSEELMGLQASMDALIQMMDNQQTVVDMDTIKQNLLELSTQITDMRDANAESLSQVIKEENTVVNQKLDALQTDVTALKDSRESIKYLDEKALPFHVESIDAIQQQVVVTVRYDNKSQPLDTSFSLAGWELIHASFSQQIAEFSNKDDAHVVVNLNAQAVQS